MSVPLTRNDGCVELEQWPDSLIRAVAAVAPELFRSGDPFAYRERDLLGYARGMALHFLEEEDLGYVDLAGYAAALGEESFRRIEVEGEQWLVMDWKNGKPDRSVEELPCSENSLLVDQWPDALIAAAGAQAPALLRSEEADAWALSAPEFDVFARYWLFEGHCDALLYPHVDHERYREELRSTFTEVTVGEEKWYLRAGGRQTDALATTVSDYYSLREWSDQLVAAVAGELPQVFRSGDYEMIGAVPAASIVTVLGDWTHGLELEIEAQGGLTQWMESVLCEDFRPVELAGERFWIYLADWSRLDAAPS